MIELISISGVAIAMALFFSAVWLDHYYTYKQEISVAEATAKLARSIQAVAPKGQSALGDVGFCEGKFFSDEVNVARASIEDFSKIDLRWRIIYQHIFSPKFDDDISLGPMFKLTADDHDKIHKWIQKAWPRFEEKKLIQSDEHKLLIAQILKQIDTHQLSLTGLPAVQDIDSALLCQTSRYYVDFSAVEVPSLPKNTSFGMSLFIFSSPFARSQKTSEPR
jgi:hypothetical protein